MTLSKIRNYLQRRNEQIDAPQMLPEAEESKYGMTFFSPDKPLTNPDQDRLGYAPFSKTIADSILSIVQPEGLVIAIHGQWGSGKSTFVEFVISYLESSQEAVKPTIIRFNPWWFSGSEDLVQHFFHEMRVTLGDKFRGGVEDLVGSLQLLSDLVSTVPLPGTGVPKKAADTASKLLFRNVHQLKADVSKKLRVHDKRIVVVVDDVDRLSGEEMKQLFTVIKAVADFPNVVYLLAFDERIVASALNDSEYLEKIVQVSFNLPLPERERLKELLFEKLREIIGEIPDRISGSRFWSDLGLNELTIDAIVDTPRKIARLANTLSVTFPAVRTEVNAADFVAIETLRVFYPEVYDFVRRNKEFFVGNSSSEAGAEYYSNILANQEKREILIGILNNLFPKLKYRNNHFEANHYHRQELRVTVYDFFDAYFRLSVSDNDVSNLETALILSSPVDDSVLSKKLIQFAEQNPNRIKPLLRRILDQSETKIRSEDVPQILKALFDVGDLILDIASNTDASAYRECEFISEQIIERLLSRQEQAHRGVTLIEAMRLGRADLLALWFIVELELRHGRLGGNGFTTDWMKILPEEDIPQLEAIAKEKLSRIYESEDLFSKPYVAKLFNVWIELDASEARQNLAKGLSNIQNLLDFVGLFLEWTRENNPKRYLNPRISYYIKLNVLKERLVTALGDNDLTEQQRSVTGAYIEAIENSQEEDE